MRVELVKGKHGETGFKMTPENEADRSSFMEWCHLLARPWDVTDYKYDEKGERLISLTFFAK
ncbi:MAG: hypothetical protein V3T41_02255 [bacterium]